MRPSHSGDGKRGTALIAYKNRQSRQRLPSGESLCFRVRTINIVITLAMMGMSLRGHREHVGNGDCYGGNFLALVAMQAPFDTLLRDLGPYACLTPGSNSVISEHYNPMFIQMPACRGPK